jgi:PAS domain S-box-containing protein
MAATDTPLPGMSPVHAAHGHSVQFYSEDRFLIDELGQFVGAALKSGSSAVIIATPGHEDSLSHHLMAQGIDLAQAIVTGRYVVLDAAQTLSTFMRNGLPDPARFAKTIGAVLAGAATAAQDENRRVVAFGEMVALLWAEGNSEAAIHLEKLWNQLARSYSFSLRCAYPMQGFCREEHAAGFLDICAEHASVIPEDNTGTRPPDADELRSMIRTQQRTQTLLAEVEAHRRQQQFWLFVEAVPDYAIFMLDPEGRVSTWNAGVERLLHHKAAEIVGTHFSCLYPLEERQSGAPQKLLESAIQKGSAEDEGWRVRRDGSKFWASIAVAAVRAEQNRLIGFGVVTHDLTERRRAELALRRSEDRFRLMAESVQDYAIFMLDPEGNVSTWNRGAERIKGYSASEIIGRHFSCFYPEKDIRAGKPQRELEIAVEEGRLEDEGWRRRKDGSRFWANVIITAVRDESGKLIGFAKVTRDVTDRMQKERSLRELTTRMLQMQDEEQRRIGRDLHDTLGQYVTALKIALDSLSRDTSSDGRISPEVENCVSLAQDCVREVRTISYLLYPPMLEEMGLISTIGWYLEGFTDRSGIQVTYDAPVHFARLPRETELALFRVLQESLTNVHRHSGSATAHVALSAVGDMITLTVKDRGKGIPAAELAESGNVHTVGVGFRGMKERLAQVGGTLEISSSAGGAIVTATVPASETVGKSSI